ncbi:hypothetical protein FVB9288_01393 [Flavobacterium sp. CECT 9288]|uniref:hypothetical protein n=1 Tax=Flavobacterium sp. CECT 9288 TaxID=2845819 RepID=UPI001E3C6786|nr:hypothetical protein [Flavobacterium sp. CECT 9288]CAH0335739.1 hypothetical protein FVB9288_01393 [Flavobacterium sp. CECT 9288]
MIDPKRPYSRIAIDKIFGTRKKAMQKEALIRGSDGLALYTDCYTGQILRGGERYDYEHIRSSEMLHSKYKHILTDEQIALVVNCPENVSVTLRTINQSKLKQLMEDWMTKSNNITKHNINLKLTLSNLKIADEGIERMVNSLMK